MEEVQQKLRELEIAAHSANAPMDLVVMGVRRQFYYAALQRSGGNRCKAGRAMGKHRNTIERAEKELNIDAKEIRKQLR